MMPNIALLTTMAIFIISTSTLYHSLFQTKIQEIK